MESLYVVVCGGRMKGTTRMRLIGCCVTEIRASDTISMIQIWPVKSEFDGPSRLPVRVIDSLIWVVGR
jgi:hypothetical protein